MAFIFIVSLSFTTILFAPHRKILSTLPSISQKPTSEIISILKGDHSLIIETPNALETANEELKVSLFLKSKEKSIEETISLRIQIEGRDSQSESFQTVVSETTASTLLSCQANSPTTAYHLCNGIILFRDRFIHNTFYRITVKLVNMESMYLLLDNRVLEVELEYSNPNYLLFETVLRSIFCALSVVMSIYFVTIVWSRQYLIHWKLEQRVLVFFFVGLIFFNNPIFFASWYFHSSVLSFVNIVFVTLFGCMFILLFLFLSHGSYVPRKDRSIFLFYIPKLILVMVLFGLVITLLSYERFYSSNDPTFEYQLSLRFSLEFFDLIPFFILIVLVLIGLISAYHVLRSLSNFKNIQTSLRFRYFVLLTFLVLVVSGICFASYLLADYVNSAAQTLSLFPLFTFYGVMLAIFFSPSLEVEDDPLESVVELEDFQTARIGKELNLFDEEEDEEFINHANQDMQEFKNSQ